MSDYRRKGNQMSDGPDETAAELAALRKEKADREAAERKAKDDELADLKKYKEETEAARNKAPKPPKTKTEKEAEAKPDDKPDDKPLADKPKSSHGGSRRWFGE